MINLLLAKGWGSVALIIGGMFVAVFILATIYSTITEKAKIKDDSGCGWPIFLVIVAIIVGSLLNMKSCNCKGTHNNNYDSSDEYWENSPRHT